MWYKILCFLAKVVFSTIYRFKYEGLENIPKTGGYILLSNHVTALDPPFVAFKISSHIHFMAKAELFENPILNWLGNALEAFPVVRGKGDMTAVNTSVSYIKNGAIVGLFPEGTRSKTGKPLRPKSGAAMIAKAAQADILPCAISIEGVKLRLGCKITVRYGPLIPYSHLQMEEEGTAIVRKGTKIMWNGVLRLLGEAEVE